jgi:hypothetical protein
MKKDTPVARLRTAKRGERGCPNGQIEDLEDAAASHPTS